MKIACNCIGEHRKDLLSQLSRMRMLSRLKIPNKVYEIHNSEKLNNYALPSNAVRPWDKHVKTQITYKKSCPKRNDMLVSLG